MGVTSVCSAFLLLEFIDALPVSGCIINGLLGLKIAYKMPVSPLTIRVAD